MAFEMTQTLPQGINAQNCYVRIDRVDFYSHYTEVFLGYYFNKESRDNGFSPIMIKSIRLAPQEDSDGNVLFDYEKREDMYTTLKTFDEFKEAKDI